MRFYNCFALFYDCWYSKKTRTIRKIESSYGNGVIQVIVQEKHSEMIKN